MFKEWYREVPGERYYRCSWAVEQPRAVVQITHGMGEHIGRYQGFAEYLNGLGFSVYGLDLRGHGNSCIASDLGYMGAKGWAGCLSDMAELAETIAAENPGIPHILFGHSMGAIFCQQYITEQAEGLAGVILSGSPGFVPSGLAGFARLLSRFEAWRQGPAAHSGLLRTLVFDANNKAFKTEAAAKAETQRGFEWLSRDPAAVQAYTDDPLCGFVLSNGSMAEFFAGALAGQSSAGLKAIPGDLPMMILSGSADPVHNDTNNLRRMRLAYEALGLAPHYKLYLGGRHEMLNETNGEQVKADIGAWISSILH